MAAANAEYYCGANVYYLMTRAAAEGSERDMVLDTLDAIDRMGLTVVRTWAFADGEQEWNALQPQPGKYSEAIFKGLDFVIAECAKRGLRLMLTLTNYWTHFGGMPQYIKWSTGNAVEDGRLFYTDATAKQLYKDFITAVINRVNSITGKAYKDDDTIFAWDIVNEARCPADPSGRSLTLWLKETADYIKSLDSRHLVTAGLEGFFGPTTPEYLEANPYNTEAEGNDFVANFSAPSLDFCCIHMYGDQWLANIHDDKAVIAWSEKWMKAHMAAARAIRKPLCIQEFGKHPGGQGRTDLFKKVYGLAIDSMKNKDVLHGNVVWMVASDEYPDYDGYTLYENGTPGENAIRNSKQPVVKDIASVEVLISSAAEFNKPAPS